MELIAAILIVWFGIFILIIVGRVCWATVRTLSELTVGNVLRALTPGRRFAGRPSRRERRQAEERQRAEMAAQRRREDARAACELLYALYAPEIGERFPRAEFETFVRTYLNDQKPAEYVEERSRQLQETIRRHKEHVDPPQRFTSLTDLTAWFEEQKRQIDGCPDERMKRSLLVQLKERYSDLSAQMLERI